MELVNKFALYFLLNSIFLLLFPRYAQLLIAIMLVGYVVFESSMSNRVLPSQGYSLNSEWIKTNQHGYSTKFGPR